jgi:hypothetical protein
MHATRRGDASERREKTMLPGLMLTMLANRPRVPRPEREQLDEYGRPVRARQTSILRETPHTWHEGVDR